MSKYVIELKPPFQITHLRSAWDFNWNGGFASPGEMHEPWEIVYTVSGAVDVTEDTRLYSLGEGDMIIHAPLEFHTIQSANGTSPNVYIVCVAVDGELPRSLASGVFSLTDDERKEFKALFSRISNFYYDNKENFLLGKECMDALSSFLIRLSLSHPSENRMIQSRSAIEYNKVVTTMTELVYNNCTLEDIAAYNNMSVSNIKVLFKRYCGISPKIYYARLRCTEAIKLLSEGYTAAETSEKLGFSSPGYFNTFFKRMTGYPPSTYIKTKGKNNG